MNEIRPVVTYFERSGAKPGIVFRGAKIRYGDITASLAPHEFNGELELAFLRGNEENQQFIGEPVRLQDAEQANLEGLADVIGRKLMEGDDPRAILEAAENANALILETLARRSPRKGK